MEMLGFDVLLMNRLCEWVGVEIRCGCTVLVFVGNWVNNRFNCVVNKS